MSHEKKLTPLASIPNEHQRSDVGTYLKLPQWSEIFIKEEFFNYIKSNKTNEFPYLQSIKTYWHYYHLSYKLTKNKNINILSHLKMCANAFLFTGEYVMKLIYDACMTKIRHAQAEKSPKEEIIDMILQEYIDFIKNNPWYEFDFLSRLTAYYKYSPEKVLGQKIRFTQIEKTWFLTTSFLFKQIISQVIKMSNAVNYTRVNKTTVIEVDYYPESLENNSEINVIGEYQKHILLELPHYKDLKEYIKKLQLDNNLYSIAGNKDFILVSCLFTEDIKSSVIKMVPLITNPVTSTNKLRVIYQVPVFQVPGFMKFCHNRRIHVEHLLDF